MINKYLIAILLFLTLLSSSVIAQTSDPISPSDLDTPIQSKEGEILELIAVFKDAIDAPTEYNEYVQPYINLPGFPIKHNSSKEEYDNKIRNWIEDNPSIIEKFKKVRIEAHEKLYGPRKK